VDEELLVTLASYGEIKVDLEILDKDKKEKISEIMELWESKRQAPEDVAKVWNGRAVAFVSPLLLVMSEKMSLPPAVPIATMRVVEAPKESKS